MSEHFGAIASFLPLILLFVIFYFLLIRPQQAQQKKRKEMLSNLKKGDRVVSIGGIYGMLREVRDDVVVLRIADNINIKLARGGIERILEEEE
jgi:preprotein translocase subunit YajC